MFLWHCCGKISISMYDRREQYGFLKNIIILIPKIYSCPCQNLSYKYSKQCSICCDSLRPILFCDILCQDIYYIFPSSWAWWKFYLSINTVRILLLCQINKYLKHETTNNLMHEYNSYSLLSPKRHTFLLYVMLSKAAIQLDKQNLFEWFTKT